MRNLSFTHKLCVSVCWGLLLVYAAAERQYFIGPHNASWEQARNHCQICYKEMVTLTPENVDVVARMIDYDHWIGLRKYVNYNGTYNDTSDYDYEDDYFTDLNNATNASSKSFGTPWTRWANGDPLVFQNWYPGFPVFKSPLPKIDCCSCSCTCPAPIQTTTTSPSTVSTVTGSTSGNTNRNTNGNTSGNSTGTYTSETDSYDMTDFTGPGDNQSATTDLTKQTNYTSSRQSAAVFSVHTTDSPWTTTSPTTPQPPVLSTCERSPMLPPIIPETNKNYIENSCVVMLPFGPWVERVCLEQLPFICYEDRFMGSVTASNISASSASLRWDQGPGDLSHYRLEVVAPDSLWNFTTNLLDLSFELKNLTAGTHYSVQVFPVKCGRDLNPQNKSFFTIPGEVTELKVTNYTETSVSLSWKKPDGNYGFFNVTAKPLRDNMKTEIRDNITAEDLVFDRLIPGLRYNFVFITLVNDSTRRSKEANITACTKPGKVSQLEAINNSDTHLRLQWYKPTGFYDNFNVKVFDRNGTNLNANVTEIGSDAEKHTVEVTQLPNANQIKLYVTAVSHCGDSGDTENITTFTAPGPVTDLNLKPTHNSITANWKFDRSNGKTSNFTAELFLGHEITETNSTAETVTFENLSSATNYTLKVYAVTADLRSPETSRSIFTLPLPPTNIKLTEQNKTSLTFKWEYPGNSTAIKYNCSISSNFWGHVENQTTSDQYCQFTGLKSGSRYNFEVYTVSNGNGSEPAKANETTAVDKVEIGLSMLCSSKDLLYCDKNGTRVSVFSELKKHLEEYLGGKVYYEAKKGPTLDT
ncbi:receptor-type tyrosine-protein phosphatase eta [Fundulus diaphanus]